MKAEDLMKSSWVKFDGQNYTVDEILEKEVKLKYVRKLFKYVEPELLKPIPLTEENIVELLGFEPVKGITGLYANKKGIEVDFDCNTVKVPNFVKRIRRPKHVHKLQQLIKALEE